MLILRHLHASNNSMKTHTRSCVQPSWLRNPSAFASHVILLCIALFLLHTPWTRPRSRSRRLRWCSQTSGTESVAARKHSSRPSLQESLCVSLSPNLQLYAAECHDYYRMAVHTACMTYSAVTFPKAAASARLRGSTKHCQLTPRRLWPSPPRVPTPTGRRVHRPSVRSPRCVVFHARFTRCPLRWRSIESHQRALATVLG
jgi:hypothetical protein